LPEGVFNLTTGLSLDVDGVTVLGAGQDKTILDFAGQTGAGEGLLVTSDNVTLMAFGIRDTKGDGIKSKGADGITYRDITVDWSGEPDEGNGAYGVYPVESRDVLVENVTVRGASDAGIYVGQSENIIVRNSLAEFNVAGIEIENSSNADVYGNIARDNTGGILVFDLPDLPVIGGHSTRIFNNQIVHNNTRNFAPAGNIVAGVPSGTGVIILANRDVHVFDNDFADNRSAHVLLTAYTEPFTDERYNPLPRDIVVRNNRWSGGGTDPQGMLAPMAEALGGTLPAIVADGVTHWPGAEPQAVNLVIDEAPEIGFVNLGIGAYPINPETLAPSMDRPQGTPVTEPAAVVLPQDAE
jgi:parallel beta-helix repeat protein